MKPWAAQGTTIILPLFSITVSASALTSTTDYETDSEYLEIDADTKGYPGMTVSLLLPVTFGTVTIVVLMLAVLVWIWCLKTR